MRSRGGASPGRYRRASSWVLCLSLLWALSTPTFAADSDRGAADGLDLLSAVRLLLAHDPEIEIVRARREGAEGSLLAARGLFDGRLDLDLEGSDLRAPLSESESEETRTVAATLGFRQLLRSGLTLEPSLSLTGSDLPDEPGGAESAVANVAFAVRQPLLRGRGRHSVAAGETAASWELEASSLDLSHAVALRIREMAGQYWLVESARLNLEILSASEASSRRLLETTQRLVEADVTPAAEIVLLEADLTAKEAARIAGERDLFVVRRELARQIGLGTEMAAGLALPATPFPAPTHGDLEEGAAVADLLALAVERRGDLQATRSRLRAAESLEAQAANDLLPGLDVVLTPSYSGFSPSTSLFSPLYDNVPGLSTSLALELSWPTRNRLAEGRLLEAESRRREIGLGQRGLELAIQAAVASAYEEVRRGIEGLEKARRAVTLFEQALRNEEKKLRAGSSTLIDVISQQDRLTGARQSEVGAALALALALLDLRFQSGTLLVPEGVTGGVGAVSAEGFQLNLDSLTTLPRARPRDAATEVSG